jgi:CBS domain containing-hemolysin-like protein
VLIRVLYPFVILAEKLTGGMVEAGTLTGFSRSEFAAMADVSAEEGVLAERESEILKNLLQLRQTQVQDVMTPRTVLFSLPETTTVEGFFQANDQTQFSRIPIYAEDPDQVNGFVLRADMLLAQARGEIENTLVNYRREILVLPESISLANAFNQVMVDKAHIALVVDEYGDLQGILTLEDILETLLGMEIVDEADATVDMRELAQKKWEKRAKKMGLDL